MKTPLEIKNELSSSDYNENVFWQATNVYGQVIMDETFSDGQSCLEAIYDAEAESILNDAEVMADIRKECENEKYPEDAVMEIVNDRALESMDNYYFATPFCKFQGEEYDLTSDDEDLPGPESDDATEELEDELAIAIRAVQNIASIDCELLNKLDVLEELTLYVNQYNMRLRRQNGVKTALKAA